MQKYKIQWEIDIEAETAEQAAAMALDIQRDPESIATVFIVTDETGDFCEIDFNPQYETAKEKY